MNYYKDNEQHLIENYELAKKDNFKGWDLHHRLELTLDGEFAHTPEDLIRMDMYYNRPYFELIYLKHGEHTRLHARNRSSEIRAKYSKHRLGSKLSEETKLKISSSKKGCKAPNEGIPRYEFGIKFKEHYGITREDDLKLYHIEHQWYRRHNNKCRWELSS